jgi:hypothetical protein
MKNNLPVLVGIGLPVAFVVALFAFVALPGMFGAKPTVDFIFSSGSGESYQTSSTCEYDVVDGKLVREGYSTHVGDTFEFPTGPKQPEPCTNKNSPELYQYSASTGALRILSFEDAQKLTLDQGPTSSDGFIVRASSHQYDIFDVLGAGENRSTIEIVKDGRARVTIDFPADEYYYYEDRFDFVGWIVR